MADGLPIWAVISITLSIGLCVGCCLGWFCRNDMLRYNAQRAAAERASRLTRVVTIRDDPNGQEEYPIR